MANATTPPVLNSLGNGDPPSRIPSNDEKNITSIDDSAELLNIPGYDAQLIWDMKEERAAIRKADFTILGFIIFLFVFMQFDRTNLSNALTGTIRKDINITTADINTSTTLFTLGFVLTEIPFNIISKRLGPENFLPITMFFWGVCTWAQVFMHDRRGLWALRFFIGALEGGYIPGMALYIKGFYTNRELGLRFAAFWSSNAVAGCIAGPLALGLLSLDGKHGMKGWKWLFAVEGALTSFLAIIAFFYMPHSAARPKSFLGHSFNVFTPRQASILTMRTLREDPSKARGYHAAVSAQDIKDTFLDWRVYGHIITAFLSMLMITPMNTYAPSIIQSLGFTQYAANGMNSVGSAVSLILVLSLAFNSDRVRERGFHIAFGFCVGVVGLFWISYVPYNKWLIYTGIVITQGGQGSAQAINAAWLSTVVEDRKRPIALAMYVMAIQIANFPGSQLIRVQDAPRYAFGFTIAGSCCAAAAVVILVWKYIYNVTSQGSETGTVKEEGGSFEVV
ncbi:hypothetical protein G7Y89_g13596 [Cudoniella acicularis]|uniref:Major facilitator superfamily (MFS) profile domain-containing protein n=1 Tax=Cudoniella acicularis TaxID=354080 RepID=A0A8H4R749_9HELO|nr:hypothetical protein G7Y89_g13596 [Cudoniella acicularis]